MNPAVSAAAVHACAVQRCSAIRAQGGIRAGYRRIVAFVAIAQR